MVKLKISAKLISRCMNGCEGGRGIQSNLFDTHGTLYCALYRCISVIQVRLQKIYSKLTYVATLEEKDKWPQ